MLIAELTADKGFARVLELVQLATDANPLGVRAGAHPAVGLDPGDAADSALGFELATGIEPAQALGECRL
jgi:hypothetical protein